MTKIIGVAASLLVNLSLVLAFARTSDVPNGEVSISYADVPTAQIAQAPISLNGERTAAL